MLRVTLNITIMPWEIISSLLQGPISTINNINSITEIDTKNWIYHGTMKDQTNSLPT
jgi:hypothetical protein